jgi:hypothetical protein
MEPDSAFGIFVWRMPMDKRRGQLIVIIGKGPASAVFTWERLDREQTLDVLSALQDYFNHDKPLDPLYRTGSRTGAQLSIRPTGAEVKEENELPGDLDLGDLDIEC